MSRRRLPSAGVFLMAWLGLPGLGLAQSLDIDLGDGSVTGQIVRLVVLVTVLSLAPSILVMVTSFTRIIVVLAFPRSALGLQQTPPNAVLISLALFVTAFVMAPVLERAYEVGIAPLLKEEIDEREAFARASEPLQAFMLDHTARTPRRRDSPRAG
jgi:flagellar biosynthetic protein FliP